jgi:hypothetical protein
MANSREIKEGVQDQGRDEEMTYSVTIPTTWGTPTGTPTVTVYSHVNGTYTDVTSTVMPSGAASINSQVVTLPEIKLLTEGVTYLVEVLFDTSEGNTQEFKAWLACTR